MLELETIFRWHYFMLYFMLLTHVWVEIFEGDAGNGRTLRLRDNPG